PPAACYRVEGDQLRAGRADLPRGETIEPVQDSAGTLTMNEMTVKGDHQPPAACYRVEGDQLRAGRADLPRGETIEPVQDSA
ncbi:hypothetical protein CQA89_32690, partial [Klebsiella pneumoniae]